jgi:hypothetical protein
MISTSSVAVLWVKNNRLAALVLLRGCSIGDVQTANRAIPEKNHSAAREKMAERIQTTAGAQR